MNADTDSSDSVASDVEESAKLAMDVLLPAKSRIQYETAYVRFEKWCQEKKVKHTTENILLAYFQQKSKVQKPSSLWSHYSMLRTMISKNENIDISKYNNLIAFLKRQSEGYKAKKSKVLTKKNIENFLTKADDLKFLMMKVALIFGIAGGCRRDELSRLLVNDIEDKGDIFVITIPHTKTKTSRQFLITCGNFEGVNLVKIVQKYIRLRPPKTDHCRFFIAYRNGQCIKQPVGINTFGAMPKNIAIFLGLTDASCYTGHCFRRSSASLLADSGADILTLKRHGAWKSATVAEGYVENSLETKRKTAIKILGEAENSKGPLKEVGGNLMVVAEKASNIITGSTIAEAQQPGINMNSCANCVINIYNNK